MSVSPGTYNFTIQRGQDWNADIQFKDANNAAINLTGATVAASVFNKNGSKNFADFGVVYSNRANGQINISLTDVQTALFPDLLFYDLLVTDSNGLKNYYLKGSIAVEQTYTT